MTYEGEGPGAANQIRGSVRWLLAHSQGVVSLGTGCKLTPISDISNLVRFDKLWGVGEETVKHFSFNHCDVQ